MPSNNYGLAQSAAKSAFANYGSPALSATETCRERDVERSVKGLHEIAQALDNRVSLIRERLTGVLRPSGPDAPKCPTEAINVAAPMSVEIDSIAYQFRASLNIIEDLLQRLEV